MSITILSYSPNPKTNSETRNPEISENSKTKNSQKSEFVISDLVVESGEPRNLTRYKKLLVLGIVITDSGNKNLLYIFS